MNDTLLASADTIAYVNETLPVTTTVTETKISEFIGYAVTTTTTVGALKVVAQSSEDGVKGFVAADLHVAREEKALVEAAGFTARSTDSGAAFVTTTVSTVGMFAGTKFTTFMSVDQAVALRDSLTKAIRAARR